MPRKELVRPYDPACRHEYQTEYPKLAAVLGALEWWVHGDFEQGAVTCLRCDGEHVCEHDYGDWHETRDEHGTAIPRNDKLVATCKDCGYTHPCTHPRWKTDHGAVFCAGPCGQYAACTDCDRLLNGQACACAA